MISLTGCSQQQAERGLLPGTPDPVSGAEATNHVKSIIDLWNGSWLVLWGVGIIAWALMAYAIVVYRRRKGDNSLPKQIRYNNPIETLFTVVPFILVIGFFAFTAKTMTAIETPYANPDVKIQAIGKQWSWDFNYKNENTYESGIQGQGVTEADIAKLPTLWLPVNKKIQIDLNARDVNHSFWVVDFLYKKDMIPGQTNHWYVTPEKEGSYRGKCAELCGEYHSLMLFTVKVVSQSEYDAYIQSLRDAGQTGQLGADLNTNNDGTNAGTNEG